MSLTNNPIYLNFQIQKSLEIFENNSADKIWSNKDIGVKMPCPMPDRVKKSLITFVSLTISIITFWLVQTANPPKSDNGVVAQLTMQRYIHNSGIANFLFTSAEFLASNLYKSHHQKPQILFLVFIPTIF